MKGILNKGKFRQGEILYTILKSINIIHIFLFKKLIEMVYAKVQYPSVFRHFFRLNNKIVTIEQLFFSKSTDDF